MEVLRAAARFSQRPAVVSEGVACSFSDLLEGAATVSSKLSQVPEFRGGAADAATGPRVAIMAQPGPEHVASTWGSWLAGGVAVPLCLSHPPKQLAYMVEDSAASVVLATEQHAEAMEPIARSAGAAFQVVERVAPHPAGVPSLGPFIAESFRQRDWASSAHKAALFIYTSGTTGAPKGVVHTHASLAAQVTALQDAWQWSQHDRLLHALPLHHIHGAVVALHTAHASGACVEFLPKFSPAAVWDALQRREDPVSLFMGVPTMYNYLLKHHAALPPEQQTLARHAAAGLRLAVSGSAPLPVSLFDAWRDLAGQPLLERYGMTEAGMLLSNSLAGERRAGCVGAPLPGVEARLAPAGGDAKADGNNGDSGAGGGGEGSATDGSSGGGGDSSEGGELQVRGPNLFREYWRRPGATADAFTTDGWFCTGDTAAVGGDPPSWRILGRTSVDMISSGGYRISGLELENVLARHSGISEVAVLGMPHPDLGEQVAALVARSDPQLDAAAIQSWAADEMAPYQVPRRVEFVGALPRNAMGKVNKKALLKDYFGGGDA